MVALSIHGLRERSEISELVDGFAASRRYIFDYLVDEVLDQRPADTQTFLLQTSLLDRLNPSLCTAVTGQDDSVDALRDLEHRNLFLFPLDDDRLWFRYHHLFAELLRRRLHRVHADLVDELHLRASRWYEENDHPETPFTMRSKADTSIGQRGSVRFSARGHSGRATCIRRSVGWEMLPAEQIERRPRLGILYVWALLLTNELDQVETFLRAAEDRLEEARISDEIVEEWGLADPARDLARMEGGGQHLQGGPGPGKRGCERDG